MVRRRLFSGVGDIHQENAKLIIMGNYLDLPIITCKLHSAQSLTATLILHVNLH